MYPQRTSTDSLHKGAGCHNDLKSALQPWLGHWCPPRADVTDSDVRQELVRVRF
jgi:hypothetical protein